MIKDIRVEFVLPICVWKRVNQAADKQNTTAIKYMVEALKQASSRDTMEVLTGHALEMKIYQTEMKNKRTKKEKTA